MRRLIGLVHQGFFAHSPSSSSFCHGSRIDSTSSSSGGPFENSAGASGGWL
jgi:hypothetical protein